METWRHWWNGRWGRLARHDVFIRVDGDMWMVESREGGSDGRSRFLAAGDEDVALDIARSLLTGDGWRELTS